MNMKKIHTNNEGFTAIELLITLFITAIFLFSGIGLFTTIVNYSSDARNRAQADRIAYDYLRRYEANVSTPCAASTPLNHVSVASDTNAQGLVEPTITVQITCPLFSSIPNISKVVTHVEYRDGGTTITVEQEVYASQ